MTAASGVSAAEVEEAVRAYVAAKAAEGADRVALTGWDLAKLMGLNIAEGRYAWERSKPIASLDGQATRALDKLAAAGGLVRVGANDWSPDGKRYRGMVTYWTPGGAKAAEAERDRRAAERAEIRRQWEEVNGALADRGIYGTHLPHEAPKLSLGSWQALVKILHSRAWPGTVPATESEGR